MKALRNLKFVNHVPLLALTLCFSAGLGKAQNAYEGKFTLPFDAQWAGVALAAGDYTISMPSTAPPYLLYVRGEGKTAIIMADGANGKALSNHSQLTIVNTGGSQAIAVLEAGELGLTFDYRTSKAKMRQVAQVQIPVLNAHQVAGGR